MLPLLTTKFNSLLRQLCIASLCLFVVQLGHAQGKGFNINSVVNGVVIDWREVPSVQNMLYSELISHFSKINVWFDNPEARFTTNSEENPNTRVNLVTRDQVKMELQAWPDAQAALKYTVAQIDAKRIAASNNSYVTLVITSVPDGYDPIALGKMVQAFNTYVPETYKSMRPEMVWKWHSLNASSKRQASYMVGYLKEFPNSPYRETATLLLENFAHPLPIGKLRQTDAACVTQIKPQLMKLAPKLDLTDSPTDYEGKAVWTYPKNKAEVDALPVEKRNYFDVRVVRDGSCMLLARWASSGGGLSDCRCERAE
jgi:hypothetical protein